MPQTSVDLAGEADPLDLEASFVKASSDRLGVHLTFFADLAYHLTSVNSYVIHFALAGVAPRAYVRDRTRMRIVTKSVNV